MRVRVTRGDAKREKKKLECFEVWLAAVVFKKIEIVCTLLFCFFFPFERERT